MVSVTHPALVSTLAVALAVVHLLAGRFHLAAIPRSYWLSGAGGVSVAYVFVHVLPELAIRQQTFEGRASAFLAYHIYLLALVGFALFYGLERTAKQSKTRSEGAEIRGEGTNTSTRVFWPHVGSFAVYNVVIGYLLVHREESGLILSAVIS